MADPIGDFMLITGCSDEEKAIELLSQADFDVQTAVAIYNATRGDAAAPSNRSNGSGNSEIREAYGGGSAVAGGFGGHQRRPSTYDSDGDNAFGVGEAGRRGGAAVADVDADEELARALAASEREAFGGGGGAGGFGGVGDDDEFDARGAEDYAPSAHRMLDAIPTGGQGLFVGGGGGGGGGRSAHAALDKNLMAIDDAEDFDTSFVNKHFGPMPMFRPPHWGCESRYVYHGEDPALLEDNNFGAEANPIITHFKYCCGIAEKQKKYVFLLILRGERTFCDSCCIRDLLSTRSSAATFLKENFLSFFQVVIPGSLEHVRTTQLARLQINQPDVRRMMHLSSFLSTYQIGTSPQENLLPGGQYPPRVETEEQKKVYNVFCRNPFPVLAVIDPTTQSLVRRIPVGQIYRVRNNVAEFDSDRFMEELAATLDGNMIGDNFFLRDDSVSGAPLDVDNDSASVLPTAKGSGAAAKATTATPTSAPQKKAQQKQQPSSTDAYFDVDGDGDGYDYGDNTYDYGGGGGYVAEEAAGHHHEAKGEKAAAAPSSSSDAAPQSEAAAETVAAAASSRPLISSTVIDVSRFCAPAVPSQDCFKLRIGTPKGQLVLEVAKAMPLKLFLAYVTALCTPASAHKMLTAAEAAAATATATVGSSSPPSSSSLPMGFSTAASGAPGMTPTPPNSPPPGPLSTHTSGASNNGGGSAAEGPLTAFTFDAALAKTISKTKFLGGFPPRPLDVDSEAFLAPIAAIGDGEAEGVAPAEASERLWAAETLLAGEGEVTLEGWGKIRANDSLRPSLP